MQVQMVASCTATTSSSLVYKTQHPPSSNLVKLSNVQDERCYTPFFIMRLLHSTNLELVEFMERDLPPYIILSHTWEAEEVSF
jgi:hypothetical protein